MSRSWTWHLGRVAGIDVRVHWSFAGLMVLYGLWDLRRGGDLLSVLIGAAFTLAVFGSVLVHEYGHALTARRYGVGTRDITLYPVGGVAALKGRVRSPKHEFWIAIAGPATNAAMGVGFGGLAWAIGRIPNAPSFVLGLGQFLASLAIANLVIGVFNLLPAFPMDGGRILRAILVPRVGLEKATRWSVAIGRALALGLIGLGIAYEPMLAIIGLVVFVAAGREVAAARHSATRPGA